MTTGLAAAAGHDGGVIRERWSTLKIKIFDTLAPANISLVATDGPISVTAWQPNGQVKSLFGHNRGIWPVKPVRSAARKDNATATHDKNPTYFLGTQFRIWARTTAERDRLLEATVDLIGAMAERAGGLAELLHGFRDVGPDLSLEMFEFEIHAIGQQLGIITWDDAALSRFLDAVEVRVRSMEAGSRSGRHSQIEVAIVAELERFRAVASYSEGA